MFIIHTDRLLLYFQITKDDKLPQNMCSLCISYMKHAVMFRQQIINNTKYISSHPDAAARILNNNLAACNHRFNTMNDPDDSDEQQQMNVDWNNTNFADETFDNLKFELDSAFGGAYESSDEDEDDEDDDPSTNATLLFDYKEKKFEEDDISDLSCLKSANSKILITIPNEMRERKCDACRKRFMLKETFDQHLKECIELKLLTFITEGYQLLMIRRARTLSANDFVRRVIFSLKKLVKSLTFCYNEIVDVSQQDDKNVKKSKFSDVAGDIAKVTIGNIKNNLNNVDGGDSYPNSSETHFDGEQSRNFLNLLEGKPNVLIQKNHLNQTMFSNLPTMDGVSPLRDVTPPIISSDHSMSSNKISFNKNRQLPSKRTILNNNSNDNGISGKNKLKNYFELDPSNPARVRRATPVETVIAQCSPCSESFTSLQLFEDHNRQYHNIATSSSSTASNSSQSPHMMMMTTPSDRNSPVVKKDALNADERNKLLQLLTIKF